MTPRREPARVKPARRAAAVEPGGDPAAPGPRRRRRLRAVQVALPVYWVILFTLTHLPRMRIPGRIPQSDKLAHCVAYALLAWLLWRFVATFRRAMDARTALVLWLIVALYGALDEWLQSFVGRDMDLRDWLADMAGATAVLALLAWRRPASGPS